MPTTVLVEPDLTGHRFQAVANVALRAQQDGDHVVLLTSKGAVTSDAFKVYLSDVPLEAVEVFDEIYPPTATMLDHIVGALPDGRRAHGRGDGRRPDPEEVVAARAASVPWARRSDRRWCSSTPATRPGYRSTTRSR